MPYEPTNWKSGDVVTSAKLNKMEAGIAGAGPLIVKDENGTLDKTWQEIWDAGIAFVVLSANENEKTFTYVTAVGSDNGDYFVMDSNQSYYVTNSASGYPVYNER